MNPGSPYRPGREIARGGMGAVLDVLDQKFGRSVAMKVMLRRNASEEEQQRFLQEARILGQLAHPNIVPVHDMGTDEQGQLFYTMKLVQGDTLHDLLLTLKNGHPDTVAKYPLTTLLTIFQKVCDAVAFAHSRGIIHRDLKPQNIMVGEFGEVLVMDWGLAKVLPGSAAAEESSKALPLRGQLGQTGPTGTLPIDAPAGADQATRVSCGATSADEATQVSGTTQESVVPDLRFGFLQDTPATPSSSYVTLEGAVLGTPNFMSPEQAAGRISDLDARSDIYSLGGILYALLTLRPPVEGQSLEAILAKVRSGTITPPSAFNDAAPSSVGRPARGTAAGTKPFVRLPHLPDGQVPVALSAVAMKALTVDKARRYPDVAAFAADIEAYQGGFATSAENATALTLLRLFIQRHQVLTGAATLIVLLTISFMVKVISSERKANANAERAETNAKTAKQNEERAEANAKTAEENATKATAAEARAVQKEGEARQALAKSQLDLAEKEFGLGKFVEAQKIIEETPERFREANWRFLQAHARDSTAQLSLPGKGGTYRLLVLPQGDRFAAKFFTDAIGIFTLTGQRVGDWVPASGRFSGSFGSDSAGGRLAFAVATNEVAVLEVSTGKLVRRWTCELDGIMCALISPDGGTVLAGGGKKLTAYAVQTGTPLWSQPFTGVVPAFSPDGRTVAVLSFRSGVALKIQLLDPLTGAVRSTLETTADNPAKTTLQFNQTGDRLACLGGDEAILWNPRTAAKLRALHFPGETAQLLSPDGNSVATFSGNRIRLWDATTGRLLRSLNGASTRVIDLAFSPDGKLMLSSHAAAGDGNVQVWPTRLGEEVASARPGSLQSSRVVFDSDGSKFYASAGNAGAWETRSGRETWKFSTAPANLLDLTLHPTDGSLIVSEFNKPTLAHTSSAGGAFTPFGQNDFSRIRFNRSGQLLLAVDGAFAASNPGYAFRVMEYPSGKLLRTIPFYTTTRQPFAAFCLDDTAVATAAARAGGITVWDLKAGTRLRQIAAAQTGSIGCLAASPDGRHLASGGPDRWIRVWAAATGRQEAAFRAHWEGVRCVKFSPDGREILSGSDDGTVRLHDAATGEERLAFYGLNMPVVDVDISADGKLIAAITTEGFTKVWDRQRSTAAARLPK